MSSRTAHQSLSQLTSVDTTLVTYDALGRVVEENRSGTYVESVYDPTGRKLAAMLGSAFAEARLALPGGGKAIYYSTGLSQYWHPDWLGSSRLETTTTRTVAADIAFAPYGETYVYSGQVDRSFTGVASTDTVSDLYDFMFREYSPVQGRWISPDPAGLGAVSMTNPQTWNRYAYVINRPLTLIDPLGLDPPDCNDEGGCFTFKVNVNAYGFMYFYNAANVKPAPPRSFCDGPCPKKSGRDTGANALLATVLQHLSKTCQSKLGSLLPALQKDAADRVFLDAAAFNRFPNGTLDPDTPFHIVSGIGVARSITWSDLGLRGNFDSISESSQNIAATQGQFTVLYPNYYSSLPTDETAYNRSQAAVLMHESLHGVTGIGGDHQALDQLLGIPSGNSDTAAVDALHNFLQGCLGDGI